MKWFKKNWVTILSILVAAFSGVDVAAGVAQGKSLMNVANIPAVAAGGSSLGLLLMRWFNTRTLTTRLATEGLDQQTTRMLEAIFMLAENPDIDEDMIDYLTEIASAVINGHAARARESRAPSII